MIENFSKEELMELVPSDIQKKLTKKQVLILGYFIMLDGLDESKTNGTFYRSNDDIVEDLEITEPTLLTAIRKLETLNLVERKAGIRSKDEKKASVYLIKKNNIFKIEEDMKKENEDLIKGILEAVLKIQEQITLLNDRLNQNFTYQMNEGITDNRLKNNFTYQNPLNKEISNDRLKIEDENLTQNFTSDIDIELDKDIIYNNINKNNNIIKNIDLNKNIILKENNNISDSVLKLDSTEFNEVEDNENEETIQLAEESNEQKETKYTKENDIIKTSTEMNLNKERIETTRLNNTSSVEKKVIKHSPSEHYNFLTPKEQERIFNELMERFMQSNSIEEVEEKWRKFWSYLNNHTFMITYLTNAQKAHKELLKKFQPSEEPKLSPQSLPNDDGGIVAHPKGENPTDATKDPLDGILFDSSTLEDECTPTAKSEICSLSPSNELGGVTAHGEEENASDAKEMPLNQIPYNPMERALRIRAERMEGLKKAIDDATTVEELRNAAKKINAEKNSLSTDEMAELAELMQLKAETL